MKKIKIKRIVTGITLSLFTLFNISIQPQAAVTTNNENITPTASGINDTDLNRKIILLIQPYLIKDTSMFFKQ